MRLVILPPLFLVIVLCPALCSAQGLNFLSPEEKSNYETFEFEGSAGYASNFPRKHDLLQYAPPVLVQNGGTCVGFAASYCAHSTMVNRVTGRTQFLHKYICSFDPYFHYTLANSYDRFPCDNGMDFPKVFEGLMVYGNMRDLFPPELDCDFTWMDSKTGELNEELAPLLHAANPFRIEEYTWLDLDTTNWLHQMKTCLANDIPVVIGADVTDDFSPASYGGQIDSRGIWNYKASPGATGEGHAMCVLGYDDDMAGGSFLVRNSWGMDFGADGDVWIRYGDFKDVVNEAWVILPQDWYENLYSPDDYTLYLQSTEHEDLEYVMVRGTTATYEGFVSSIPNKRVWAFELFDDGSVYFGEYVDYTKHGLGLYWSAEDGTRYVVEARNGEAVSFEAGYAASEDNTIPMAGEVKPEVDENTPSYDGGLPSSSYQR